MAATTSFSALVPTPLTTTGHFSASLSTSSLSTSDEYDSWNNTVPSGPMTNLALGVSHRSGARPNMGAGGRGTIGGGNGGADSPDPSGVHPGQQGSSDSDGGGNGGGNSGEDDENQDFTDEGGKKLPSSYTFRRRNAVVEGSEDAPRAKDYPNASTN
ncbi:hypothetical protein BGZ83_000823 [Gryganskiella cystojenkinii]|nr:hypothetical protein BGZ83_000823 [Gryganskiella cystojenkinii]